MPACKADERNGCCRYQWMVSGSVGLKSRD